jgi:hypothetical protein
MTVLEENHKYFLIIVNDPPGAKRTLGSVLMKMAQEAGVEKLWLQS